MTHDHTAGAGLTRPAGGGTGGSRSPAPAGAATRGAATGVLGMLADGVPLTLLLDLAMPAGPHSAELLRSEPPPDFAWWEPR